MFEIFSSLPPYVVVKGVKVLVFVQGDQGELVEALAVVGSQKHGATVIFSHSGPILFR